MRYSKLFSKTSKQVPHDEVSVNARLLIRSGFIEKVSAGIYTFLPFGQKVINKISQIVREEMDAIGGQEMTMPVLHPKHLWETTGRWTGFDVLFKVKGEAGEFALGATHEEIVVPTAKRFIESLRDLPKYVYQIQTKFRDEPRAKSGLMRGREFLMKDLYSFHADEADLDKYYQVVKGAYVKVFKRLNLDALEVEASGGTFAKFSHEYQVLCESGEDTIYLCPDGHFARNKEIIAELTKCPTCSKNLEEKSAAEVGNIFKLMSKYSEPFGLTFMDSDDKEKPVLMGCYGIGISRLMGVLVEMFHDDRGIIWPKSVSPFDAHLVHIEDKGTEPWARETYDRLTKAGVEVLWDDREGVSAGEKFADADLIGIPVRLVVSKRVGQGKVEWKDRDSKESKILSLEEVVKKL